MGPKKGDSENTPAYNGDMGILKMPGAPSVKKSDDEARPGINRAALNEMDAAKRNRGQKLDPRRS